MYVYIYIYQFNKICPWPLFNMLSQADKNDSVMRKKASKRVVSGLVGYKPDWMSPCICDM